MQISGAALEPLFVRRQDVAKDQRVELIVAQVIGEIQHQVFLEQLFDRGFQNQRKLMLAQPVGMGQHQRRIEPLIDRQDGCSFPLQHRFQKLVFAPRAHRGGIDPGDRLVEQRLEFIAELCVAEQMLHVIGL